MYSGVNTFLTGRSLKIYEKKESWHNLFREQVTLRIDEEKFRPLFSSENGAANASIRVLIGMMILKEALGISDEKLFEDCRFNLLIRSALGLLNIDDSAPTNSTYYLLRKRIVEWEQKNNENLIEQCFKQTTLSQIKEFEVKGQKIRMDSKLLGSNIAWYSRYELVHEMLRNYFNYIASILDRLNLDSSDIQLLESIKGESGKKVSYRNTKNDLEPKMLEIGKLIYKIITQLPDDTSKEIENLRRIFKEQYEYKEEGALIITRPKSEISAESIQSPHDTECHYRNKDDNKIKGYSINVSETCDVESLNLVTAVQVEVASTADCSFLQSAIEATQEIVLQTIATVNTDGAYHSVDNQSYCESKNIDFIISAIQGKLPRYDLLLDAQGDLIVTDTQTDTIIPTIKITSRKDEGVPKWKIKNEKGKYRYFTQKEIDTCLLRKQIGERTTEELNVRNNLEASIFQLGYHYSNDKSRYRGLIKHKIWAHVRCLWINFVRIMNFIARNGSKYAQKVKNSLNFSLLLTNFVETRYFMSAVEIYVTNSPENQFLKNFEKRDF
jgi:hypothetical protein